MGPAVTSNAKQHLSKKALRFLGDLMVIRGCYSATPAHQRIIVPSCPNVPFRTMVRHFALVTCMALSLVCPAQDRSCLVPTERYAILQDAAWKATPGSSEGGSFQVGRSDVERAECILMDFITWHNGLTRQGRDSLMDVSAGRVRSVCMSRDWSLYHRQYRGDIKDGHSIIQVNCFCREPIEIGHRTVDLTNVWYEIDDGGDCYFQTSVDLTTGEVVRFSVNGPVDPNWCR